MQAFRSNALLISVLVILFGGLAVLATLQFRWIDEASAAEELRLRAGIELAGRQFAGDLERELEDVFMIFGSPGRGDLVQREQEWRNTARHPELVERAFLDDRSDRPGPPFDSATLEIVLRQRPRAGFAFERPNGEFLDEDQRATVVQLSRAALVERVLPELVQRHFATGLDVAIASREGIVFRNDSEWPDGRTPPDVDVAIHLFRPNRGAPQGDPPPRRRNMRHPGEGPADAGPPYGRPPDAGPPGGRDADRPSPPETGRPPRRDDPPGEDSQWHLLVRRHDGGLARVVTAARRRNLAVSAGILAILVSTVGVLLYLLRRAHRLREQQTEFVAAISHELNTPVTALRSAGENLKDGIITDPQKLARYGETIVRESARLGDMIEQVLEFAGMRARRNGFASEPVDLARVIDEAIAQARWIVDDTAVRIETDVEPGLPRPAGDARALTRAIHNLVANAVRHGGSGGWVGVRARRAGRNVTITVEDRGPGIDPRDAEHLFEPFYRGRRAAAVRGSGLGLTIVQQVATAHGGSVEIDRRRRQGAAITMSLPLEQHG